MHFTQDSKWKIWSQELVLTCRMWNHFPAVPPFTATPRGWVGTWRSCARGWVQWAAGMLQLCQPHQAAEHSPCPCTVRLCALRQQRNSFPGRYNYCVLRASQCLAQLNATEQSTLVWRVLLWKDDNPTTCAFILCFLIVLPKWHTENLSRNQNVLREN